MARIAFALLLAAAACASGQALSDFTAPLPIGRGGTLVIGILGGWKRWDNPRDPVRRTALEVRAMGLPGVWVETAGNHRIDAAYQLVRRAFDFDGSGRVDAAQAAAARLIVFDQSLGGRATLRLCRRLHGDGIGVRLAVVVDGWGRDPYTVPPNVEAAADLFQRDFGFVRGAPRIRAVGPKRTRILGNWRYTYKNRHIAMPGKHRLERWFFGSRRKMEHDPAPWRHVREFVAGACTEPWPGRSTGAHNRSHRDRIVVQQFGDRVDHTGRGERVPAKIVRRS